MPGPTRINEADLKANFPPRDVDAVFCDDGTGRPGARLAAACLRASRRAEGILRRAWNSDKQLEALFREDEGVRGETCRLAMFYGAEGRAAWTGEGAPFANAEKAALAALRELADAEVRSRAETVEDGAGANPRASGDVRPTQDPCFIFASTQRTPRRGGY